MERTDGGHWQREPYCRRAQVGRRRGGKRKEGRGGGGGEKEEGRTDDFIAVHCCAQFKQQIGVTFS